LPPFETLSHSCILLTSPIQLKGTYI
jgi:hypothetical protein